MSHTPVSKKCCASNCRVSSTNPIADPVIPFGLGDSDKTITTIDADGVALAAIQAKAEEQQAEIKALRAELGQYKSLAAK